MRKLLETQRCRDISRVEQEAFRRAMLSHSCGFNCELLKHVDSPKAAWHVQLLGYFVTWKLAASGCGTSGLGGNYVSDIWRQEYLRIGFPNHRLIQNAALDERFRVIHRICSMYEEVEVFSTNNSKEVFIASKYCDAGDEARTLGFERKVGQYKLLGNSSQTALTQLFAKDPELALDRIFDLIVDKMTVVINSLGVNAVHSIDFGHRPQFLSNILYESCVRCGVTSTGHQQRVVQLVDIVHNFSHYDKFVCWDENSRLAHSRNNFVGRYMLASSANAQHIDFAPALPKPDGIHELIGRAVLAFPAEISSLPSASGFNNIIHWHDFEILLDTYVREGVQVVLKAKGAKEVEFFRSTTNFHVISGPLDKEMIDAYDFILSLAWTSPSLQVRNEYGRQAWYYNPPDLRQMNLPCWNDIYTDLQIR